VTAYLLVGIGGGLGAAARYALGGAVHRVTGAGFPAGTLVVNVLGCLLIGVVMGLTEVRPALTREARLFLTVGVLGGFTTFSSFGYETLQLLRGGQFGLAALSACGNLFVGLAAVWAGRAVGSAL
jgi:CrcB protein